RRSRRCWPRPRRLAPSRRRPWPEIVSVTAPSLRDLQALFWAALNGRQDASLEAAVASTPGLAAADRVAIYAGMYFARLRDVLAEDFEKTAPALGRENFTAVVRAYLAAHPSEHPSVRHIGRHLAAFLAVQPPAGAPPWLSDLARLEWARIEVFDAPDARPIAMADLRAVPEAEWPGGRLHPIQALGGVESAWPLPVIWRGGGGAPPAPTRPPARAQGGGRVSLRQGRAGAAGVGRVGGGGGLGGGVQNPGGSRARRGACRGRRAPRPLDRGRPHRRHRLTPPAL